MAIRKDWRLGFKFVALVVTVLHTGQGLGMAGLPGGKQVRQNTSPQISFLTGSSKTPSQTAQIKDFPGVDMNSFVGKPMFSIHFSLGTLSK